MPRYYEKQKSAKRHTFSEVPAARAESNKLRAKLKPTRRPLEKQVATLKPSSKPSRLSLAATLKPSKGTKRGTATLKPKTGPKKTPIKKPTQSISKTATSAASRSVKKTQLARTKKKASSAGLKWDMNQLRDVRPLNTPASPTHYRKKTPRRKS
jgi:hypothetical protein